MKKVITYVKKFKFNYEILQKYEAGIVLKGTEIKSLRCNGININESFVTIKNKEIYLHDSIISHYKFSNQFNHEVDRPRKLLMHKKEIIKLQKEKEQAGLTIVPIEVYLKDNFVKVTICLARGKKMHDKREVIKKRDFERSIRKKF